MNEFDSVTDPIDIQEDPPIGVDPDAPEMPEDELWVRMFERMLQDKAQFESYLAVVTAMISE
jgi:hypothetical protein